MGSSQSKKIVIPPSEKEKESEKEESHLPPNIVRTPKHSEG